MGSFKSRSVGMGAHENLIPLTTLQPPDTANCWIKKESRGSFTKLCFNIDLECGGDFVKKFYLWKRLIDITFFSSNIYLFFHYNNFIFLELPSALLRNFNCPKRPPNLNLIPEDDIPNDLYPGPSRSTSKWRVLVNHNRYILLHSNKNAQSRWTFGQNFMSIVEL